MSFNTSRYFIFGGKQGENSEHYPPLRLITGPIWQLLKTLVCLDAIPSQWELEVQIGRYRLGMGTEGQHCY